MVFAFYGNYFFLLKEVESEYKGHNKQISLKEFIEKKPNLAETILHKVTRVATKVVEKGLTRHTIVQAILYDFFNSTVDLERIKHIADLLKEKLPALLSSSQGLAVACGVFNVLDAKDRKIALKSLKDILKGSFTNPIAHLFVIHVINSLDDTILSKKKILIVSYQ